MERVTIRSHRRPLLSPYATQTDRNSHWLGSNAQCDLHSDNNKLSKENSLTELGMMVNGRGDSPNMHDIITGSNLDGTASANTCMNWTTNAEDGKANAGHHDRQGGGENPTSWNFAHPSRGCSQENLIATGGNGYFYCFAAN